MVLLVAQMIRRLPADPGDPGSIPGSGRSPGEGNGNPLQYSCLEYSMDGGAWWAKSMGLHKVGHDWATSLLHSGSKTSAHQNLLEGFIKHIVEYLMLKLSNTLATWSEEPTHGKRLMLGKIEGKKRREQQRISWLDSITNSKDRHLSQFWEIVKDRGSWNAAVQGVAKSLKWLSNWTTRANHSSHLFF